MKLDPCPWCGDSPKVETWIEISRQGTYLENGSFVPDDYEMVHISCCNAELTCQKEDAELNWNWK